jgi:site-specific DNA-methyltransferase (adenine-specific)
MALVPYFNGSGITIYHGDCRDVLLSLSEVDLLLTDPPYGVSWSSGQGSMGGIVGDDGTLDVDAVLRLALRRLRHHRHFYVFGPYDITALTVGATTELVWDKGKHSGGDLAIPWGNSHERIAFGVWTPFDSQSGTGGFAARLRRGSVLSVPRQNNGRGALTHPTEKPVMLLRQLIEASSLHGDIVLDPFLGSGTTAVAALAEGRRCIGIEVEERFCEVAAKRLAQGVLDFGALSR